MTDHGGVEPAAAAAPGQPDDDQHAHEQHFLDLARRLNWLRAGVLGANDGIISTAGLVVGVAGATSERSPVLIAGLAGLFAGALSMAGGEFTSVSTQRDTEQAALDKERWELKHLPEQELAELTELYRDRGLQPDLAQEVAIALTKHDALAAHAEVELGIDPDRRTSPWHAAWASMVAFTAGAVLPLLAIVLPPASLRVPVTMVAVTVALVLTGVVSAQLAGSRTGPAVARNVGIGMLAMGVTFAVGAMVGGVV